MIINNDFEIGYLLIAFALIKPTTVPCEINAASTAGIPPGGSLTLCPAA